MALVVNVSILLIFIATGFYFGILANFSYKKLYGQHCSFDSDCELNLNLRCQNGKCNCTTSTFYNKTSFICVSQHLNNFPCSIDNECCCGQKCIRDENTNTNKCSCTTDRWWDEENFVCRKNFF